MTFDITFRCAYSIHEGGTKYYSMFLIHVASEAGNAGYLVKVYGSAVKKTSTVKADHDEGSNSYAYLENEYIKTLKSKSKPSEYSNLFKADQSRKFDNFVSLIRALNKHGSIPALNDASFIEAVGKQNFDEMLDYFAGYLNIDVEDMYESKEDLKRRQKEKEQQEALAAQLMAQRQEHYGEVLGSW